MGYLLRHQKRMSVKASAASVHHGILPALSRGCLVVAIGVRPILRPKSHVLLIGQLSIDIFLLLIIRAIRIISEGSSFLQEQASLFVHF